MNNILDIGFGAGSFLKIADENGWQCSGSEYSPDSIKFGEDLGWNVHLGDITERDLPGPYDIIAAIEVLEHVDDPNIILSLARQRLRSGGLFYATTPNAGSINAKIFGEKWSVLSYPEHQVLLSRRSLRMLFKVNDFEQLSVKTTGFNPAEILNQIVNIRRKSESDKSPSFDRVQIGYAVNNTFESNFLLQKLKVVLNKILSILGIGDSVNLLAKKR